MTIIDLPQSIQKLIAQIEYKPDDDGFGELHADTDRETRAAWNDLSKWAKRRCPMCAAANYGNEGRTNRVRFQGGLRNGDAQTWQIYCDEGGVQVTAGRRWTTVLFTPAHHYNAEFWSELD
jgi:hypothetical protein